MSSPQGMSFEQMFEKIEQSMRELAVLPEQAVAEAEKVLMLGLPEFTGTLIGSLQVEPLEPNGTAISITEESLLASASEHAQAFIEKENEKAKEQAKFRGGVGGIEPMTPLDYITDNLVGEPPDGPYPLRIELYGAPVQEEEGKGAWANAGLATHEHLSTAMTATAQRASR